MYLRSRANELTDSSVQNVRYRLGQFVEWADEGGMSLTLRPEGVRRL